MLLVVLVVVVGLGGVFRFAHRFEPVFGRDAIHVARQASELVVDLGGLFGGAGDDQRRPRLVDQDVVHLVDDREVVAALDAVLERFRHVVAQVVEAKLGVGAVGDVAGVFDLPRRVVVGVLDRGDADPERVVDRFHPFRVAAGQVVVDGDDVNAVAGQRVEEDGERGGQGLPLAGFHLGDGTVVEDHAADQLDVVVALTEGAASGLAGQGEGLWQQVVERLTITRPGAELVGLLAQLVVREQLHLGLDLVDRLGAPVVGLELAALPHTQRAGDHVPCIGHRSRVAMGRLAPQLDLACPTTRRCAPASG